MSAKLFFLAAFLGTGGYFGYKMATHDAAVVPYSKAQVQEMLASAKRALPRKDGDGEIVIWGNGRTNDGVRLSMRYSETAPQIDCRAVITELGPNESRVFADCGSTGNGSAIGQTTQSLQEPMFDEHIQATLRNRDFDRSRADGKQAGMVMKNMGAMQREALSTADTMQRMEAEMEDGGSDADFSGE